VSGEEQRFPVDLVLLRRSNSDGLQVGGWMGTRNGLQIEAGESESLHRRRWTAEWSMFMIDHVTIKPPGIDRTVQYRHPSSIKEIPEKPTDLDWILRCSSSVMSDQDSHEISSCQTCRLRKVEVSDQSIPSHRHNLGQA